MKQRKIQRNLLEMGLDTITIDIETNYELTQNNYEFVSKKTGNLIGTMRHKQGKVHGYRLNINLPKYIHQTNVSPFTIADGVHLFEISEMITREMYGLFGENYPELVVSTCEVNATVELGSKTSIEPMLNMITHMLLTKDNNIYICVHGKKTGNRYQKVASLQSGMQIESIRTEQLSNGRMCVKIYNKSLEQNIQNKAIIRFETVYNRSGLDYAKVGRTLQEFLTVDSIKHLLNTYKSDYKKYLIDRYWNNCGHPFYMDCINVIYNDLKRVKHPTTVALMNRNIVECDFVFFKRACYKYYNKRNSAQKAISRVMQSKELEIHEGIVSDFVEISKGIVGK